MTELPIGFDALPAYIKENKYLTGIAVEISLLVY